MKRNAFKNFRIFFLENYTFLPKMLRILPALIFYFHFYFDFTRVNYWFTKIKNQNKINEINLNTKVVIFEEQDMHQHLIPLYNSIENTQIITFKSSINNHYRSEFINFVLSHKFKNADLIHIPTLENIVYTSKKYMKKFKKLPQKKIATVHLFMPDEEIKFFSDYFDVLIVFNELQKEHLNQLNINNVQAIAHPVMKGDIITESKAKLRELFDIPNDKLILSFAGFIRRDKGLGLVFDSLNMLGNEYKTKIFLNIAGNFQDDISKKTIDNIRSLDIQKRIDIKISPLSDQEMIENFVISDYFLLPYVRKYKNISGQLIEAAWRDIPVISSVYYPLGEEVNKFNLGHTFEAGSPSALCELLMKIINKELDIPIIDKNFKASLDRNLIENQIKNLYQNL